METTHKYKIIDRNTLKAKLDKMERFQLLNVLGPDHYRAEDSIPGSKNIPVDKLEEQLPKLNISKNDEIITYCAGFQCTASKMAAEKLTSMGYTNVSAYEGGVQDWKEAGYPRGV